MQERAERVRREEIREERRRERERERRLEAKDAHGGKKSKLTRDRERDVSEKIALGQVRRPLLVSCSHTCIMSAQTRKVAVVLIGTCKLHHFSEDTCSLAGCNAVTDLPPMCQVGYGFASLKISGPLQCQQANVRAGGEAMYDQRLFNQEGGMASGLASEDAYNLYDKPLFADRGSNLYRPKAAQDDELYGGSAAGAEGVRTEKFRPDKVSLANCSMPRC